MNTFGMKLTLEAARKIGDFLNMQKIQTKTPNKLLVDYLVHSYIYYSKGTSLITDFEFDSIAHHLRDVFNEVTHPHKSLIDLESLKKTTSAFYIAEDQYPTIVKSVAEKLLKKEIELC